MVKQTQNFAQLYVGLLVWLVTTIASFFFSCNKKKEIPEVATPTYRVTFDSKNGSTINVITVKPGDILTLPAGPTKKGFAFGGWYTDSQARTTPFSASTTITTNLTLYAKWNVFSLSSTGFTDGGEIPLKYFGMDKKHVAHLNVSPQLSWINAPLATTSYLITMERIEEDSQDLLNNYSNWVVYNLSADKNSLAENEPSIRENSIHYQGSCPPVGEKHTCQITIFALDLPADYFSNDDNPPPRFKAQAEQQLSGHILSSTSITGTFKTKPVGQVKPLKCT